MPAVLQQIDRDYIAQTGEIPDGLQLISDSMPLKIIDTKKTLSESISGQQIPIMRCTGIFQRADEKNANGRVYPLKVLKAAVESIQPAIKNRKVLGEYDHPCRIDDDFRVLTVSGWKEFKDIKVGDSVYSRVNGQMVLSRVNAVINEEYDGPVYHFNGRHIHDTFTAPHKIIMETRNDGKYVRQQIEATTEEIFNNRKQFNKNIIPRRAQWTGEDQEIYTIPGVPLCELKASSPNYYKNAVTDDLHVSMKTFASFLGLYLAEGGLSTNSYRVEISQKREEYKPLIREMLAGFPAGIEWDEYDGGFRIYDARLHKYLSQLGNMYTKYIPEDIKRLDGKYLEELVYWFQIGDGRLKHGRSNVFSVSKRLIDDLHECWVKSGNCCYLMKIDPPENDYVFAEHIIKVENKHPLYQLTLSDTDGIHLDDRFLKIEKDHHKGRIYCLTTEHGNFYMEHKGCSYWTGNSDAKVHLERISHLITKLWMEGQEVLGEMEIINDSRCPYGDMLACLLERKIQIGVSSRGVGDMEIVMHEGGDAYEVQDGYSLVTFDAVAEPSVTGTQLHIKESLQRRSDPQRLRMLREQLILRELHKFLIG